MEAAYSLKGLQEPPCNMHDQLNAFKAHGSPKTHYNSASSFIKPLTCRSSDLNTKLK
eukprot:c27171_g1_i1 orf=1-168(-)